MWANTGTGERVATARIWAACDLAALEHNFARVKALAPGARVMPAIKAGAYGHGALAVARRLPRADAFGVACLDEARELRAGGVEQDIVLLSGIASGEELDEVFRLRLIPVVHSHWQLDAVLAARRRLQLWVKLDTGMGRLGFAPAEAAPLYERLRAASAFVELLGWMSHFACADEPGNAHTRGQIDAFEAAVEGLPGARSLANSAAIMAWPQSHADWVRPGIMLYGASPFPARTAAELDLRPVMSLHGRVLATKTVPAGGCIGYGAATRCATATRIGVVAGGYADGLPRSLGPGGPVLAGGRPSRLLGRVSMDLVAVDLSGLDEVGAGEGVTFWGEGLPVDEVAHHAGTIGYELLAGLGERVRRVYRG